MRPADVSRTLARLIPTGRAIYLWGSPGVGKSSVVRQAAEELRLRLVDVRAALLDPVDLRGLPRVSRDRAEWCPPAFLPRDGTGVLLLDELAQAPPAVQSACLQLVLDRRVGEYELPDSWSVLAASNRQEDRAGAHRLISPLLNRFVHLDLEVSLDDWQEWAVRNAIIPEVRAFLRFRPVLLNHFEPAANPRAFPTPRAWQFVSQVLPVTPDAHLHEVVSGCVGEAASAEFVGFLRMFRELPDLDQVFADPDRALVPQQPAVLYALVGALLEKCKSDRSKVNGFVRYAARLPDEFGMLALRDLLALDGKYASLPTVQQWIARARAKGLFLSA
jgi:MoxR-like ATPase